MPSARKEDDCYYSYKYKCCDVMLASAPPEEDEVGGLGGAQVE